MTKANSTVREDDEGREFRLLVLNEFGPLPNAVPARSPHFMMFVAADARDVDVSVISDLIESAITMGCVGVSTWGPDCEKVHDIFDEIVVHRELETDVNHSRPSSWHSGESLSEALWYWTTVAGPNDAFVDSCQTWACVLVGKVVSESVLRSMLENPDLLEERE